MAGYDPIDAAAVDAALRAPVGGPVLWFERIGSTNDEAAARARAGAPEGLVIGADHQTAGRGRRGRTWLDEPGAALAVSVLLRPPLPPARAALLPLVAALAAADAVAGVTGRTPAVAWPNDILLDGRKVCGVLCELSGDRDRVHWAIVGVGVNVRGVPDVPGARWPPGTLADAAPGVRRQAVLEALLAAIGRRYAEWRDEGPAGALAALAELDGLRGRRIAVTVGDREIEGEAAGVDESGRLRLATPAGERRLGAGEVGRILA